MFFFAKIIYIYIYIYTPTTALGWMNHFDGPETKQNTILKCWICQYVAEVLQHTDTANTELLISKQGISPLYHSFSLLLYRFLLKHFSNNLLWWREVLANSYFSLSKLGSFNDFIAFKYNAKHFTVVFLFFLPFLFLVSALGRIRKSYFPVFVQFLLWVRVIRIGVSNMILRELSTHVL